MAVSWGQNKVLGNQYARYAARSDELSRLKNEYELAPQRVATGMQAQLKSTLAQQANQFAQGLTQNQTQYENSFQAQRDAYEQQMAAAIANRPPEQQQPSEEERYKAAGYYKYNLGDGTSTWISPDQSVSAFQTKPVGWTLADWNTFRQGRITTYLENNPDVAAARMNAWDHFKNFGYNEGRKW
jgi:hypothetical protein